MQVPPDFECIGSPRKIILGLGFPQYSFSVVDLRSSLRPAEKESRDLLFHDAKFYVSTFHFLMHFHTIDLCGIPLNCISCGLRKAGLQLSRANILVFPYSNLRPSTLFWAVDLWQKFSGSSILWIAKGESSNPLRPNCCVSLFTPFDFPHFLSHWSLAKAFWAVRSRTTEAEVKFYLFSQPKLSFFHLFTLDFSFAEMICGL